MNMITITPSAAERINAIANGSSNKKVRLSVAKSGCAGNKYDMTLVDAAGPNDVQASDSGADILIDPQSLFAVFGMTIGWKEDRFGRQFTFENPKETSRCGCGESFSI